MLATEYRGVVSGVAWGIAMVVAIVATLGGLEWFYAGFWFGALVGTSFAYWLGLAEGRHQERRRR